MRAGEEIWAELTLYWAADDLAAHDYSVVVQATQSPVTITKDRTTSENFPSYSLNVEVPPLEAGNAPGGTTDGGDGGDSGEGGADFVVDSWPSIVETADPYMTHTFYFAEDSYAQASCMVDGTSIEHTLILMYDGYESVYQMSMVYEYQSESMTNFEGNIMDFAGYGSANWELNGAETSHG